MTTRTPPPVAATEWLAARWAPSQHGRRGEDGRAARNLLAEGASLDAARHVLRHLPAAVRVSWFGPMQSGDAAIFVTPNTQRKLKAIESAKRRGLRTIVEVDDDWLSLDPRFLAPRQLDLSVAPHVVEEATKFEPPANGCIGRRRPPRTP